LENLTLSYATGGGAPAAIAANYLALFVTSAPTGTGGTECIDTHYARVAITWNAAVGNNPRTITNSNDVKMLNTTGAGTTATQTITGIGIYDATTTGNLLSFQSFGGSPVTIAAGTAYDFAIGALTSSLS